MSKVVGQLILIEKQNKDERVMAEIESAVEEGISSYKRRFPGSEELLAYISGKTREAWSVNGSVGGLEVFQDDAIPYPYVWIIDVRDRKSFSPQKID